MTRVYRIGTRTSPLALRQVEEILHGLKKFYPAISTEIVGLDTYGDRDKTTPISEIEGSDFFTREIDEALLKGNIDLAVHSAKDMPDNPLTGTFIAAVTESIDPFDVLVSKSNLKLDGLPNGATIGTSSQRRKEALKKFRDDFKIVDIRGNIEERLKLLDNGKRGHLNGKRGQATFLIGDGGQEKSSLSPDAIVIAAAGLLRLGLEDRITQRIPFEILRPHPLQGMLAITTREDDKEVVALVSRLDTRKR